MIVRPAFFALLASALFLASASKTVTPAGIAQNQSIYLTMRDGVKIAVDVWVPATLAKGQKVPAVLKMTSYWRAVGLAERTGAFRVLGAVGVVPTEDMNKPEADAFGAAGIALVYVDARGTGASYGSRQHPFTEDELNDYKEVVDWVITQSWSNGKVGAMGCAYEGTAAELLLTRNHPAVKAVAPMFSDFDPWLNLVSPGGVLNEWFIRFWRDGTHMLDNNDLVAVAKLKGHDVETLKRVITGVKRVAEDSSGSLLTAALQLRNRNADVYAAARKAEYKDDPFGSGPPFAAFSSFAKKDAIEQSQAPMFVWVSWFDAATVSGALSRYNTFSNPMRVVIGPWSHQARFDANPFNAANATLELTKEKRDQQLIQFFSAHLKDSDAKEARQISYYTMGENKWKTTGVWPPKGVAPRAWYFSPNNALSPSAPADADAADTYRVDFTATTGERNRWRTQAQGEDVVYADRADQDKKLLTYTSPPLDADTEITGSPVVTLYASSTENDGAFFVYLERVDASGRVTYLTEGMLHARHRAVSNAPPQYAALGPNHSFNRADTALLTPGEVAEITFDLIPTSVLLREGDRIRVAIAGHDASCFARNPKTGEPTITMMRNAAHASRIELPIAAR
ncbi:MAG: CocE/NonD family hydrolase [Candidatus Hydrogenedentes bacterium]|nr:CocE/NonD family hydrolase [Candidatus Hydrogenedentota bacterium]